MPVTITVFLLLLVRAPVFASDSPISFTMAAVSVTPVAWDNEANYSTLERYAREAARRGAQLIMTPEGFLEGYVGNQNRSPDRPGRRSKPGRG